LFLRWRQDSWCQRVLPAWRFGTAKGIQDRRLRQHSDLPAMTLLLGNKVKDLSRDIRLVGFQVEGAPTRLECGHTLACLWDADQREHHDFRGEQVVNQSLLPIGRKRRR